VKNVDERTNNYQKGIITTEYFNVSSSLSYKHGDNKRNYT